RRQPTERNHGHRAITTDRDLRLAAAVGQRESRVTKVERSSASSDGKRDGEQERGDSRRDHDRLEKADERRGTLCVHDSDWFKIEKGKSFSADNPLQPCARNAWPIGLGAMLKIAPAEVNPDYVGLWDIRSRLNESSGRKLIGFAAADSVRPLRASRLW